MWLDAFYHSLNPVALSLGPLSIRWYGLAYLVGFVLAGVVMYRTAQRWKLNVTLDDVLNLMVGISFGVIVGARLFYVIFYGAGYYVAHPLDAFALSQGGMSFHGGLVGAVVGGSIVCKASGSLSLPSVTWELLVRRLVFSLDAAQTSSTVNFGESQQICLGE